MSIFLILFLVSLVGITFMICKRLLLMKKVNNFNINPVENSFEIPSMEEIKFITVKKFRKYGYILLVITLRFYVKSSNFLKNKYNLTKEKTKAVLNKYMRTKENNIEAKEVSGFLKTISEYKQKIGKIKHRIKKEEEKEG